MGQQTSRFELGKRKFQVGRVLGFGAFGKVYVLRDKTGKFYAMKTMSKAGLLERKRVKHVVAEKNILKELRHPYIVNLWGAGQNDKSIYLILDMMIGGELAFHLGKQKKFSEDLVKFITGNVLLALSYLASQGVIHRDIKPRNILLDDKGCGFLTDFNVATRTNELGFGKGRAGTATYMAPEVIRREEYTAKADMWGLGVVVYEMVYGSVPWHDPKISDSMSKWLKEFDSSLQSLLVSSEGEFEEKKLEKKEREKKEGERAKRDRRKLDSQSKKILRERVDLPDKPPMPHHFLDFLSKLLCPQEVRLNADEAMAHPWLSEIDFDAMMKGKLASPLMIDTGRPNIDVDVQFYDMAQQQEEKRLKKVKLTEKELALFSEWDWLCDELQKEAEEEASASEDGVLLSSRGGSSPPMSQAISPAPPSKKKGFSLSRRKPSQISDMEHLGNGWGEGGGGEEKKLVNQQSFQHRRSSDSLALSQEDIGAGQQRQKKKKKDKKN